MKSIQHKRARAKRAHDNDRVSRIVEVLRQQLAVLGTKDLLPSEYMQTAIEHTRRLYQKRACDESLELYMKAINLLLKQEGHAGVKVSWR
jgi:hypothetical protein